MSDVRSDLERARSNFPAPEMPLEGVLLRRDRRRRNQRIAAGVLGIAIVLIAAAGGASLLRSDSRPGDQPDPGLAPILREGEVLEPVDNGLRGPVVHLDALDPATGATRTLVDCVDPCGWLTRYALSPDGRWLAYEVRTCVATPCEPEAGVWVTNAAGDQRQLTSATETPWAWSAQGATLLAADGDEVFSVDPFDASRTPIGTTSPESGPARPVSALAGSPDGSLVAFGDRGSVWVVPSDGGGDVTHVVDVGDWVRSIDWSPDGTRLAVGVNRVIYTVDVADRDFASPGFDEGSGGKPAFPAWSPDGSRIAFVTTPKRGVDFVLEVWVVNPVRSSPVRVFRDRECCPNGTSGPPVWSPDGSWIAFDAEFRGRWFVVPADGSGPAEPFSAGEAEAWRIS